MRRGWYMEAAVLVGCVLFAACSDEMERRANALYVAAVRNVEQMIGKAEDYRTALRYYRKAEAAILEMETNCPGEELTARLLSGEIRLAGLAHGEFRRLKRPLMELSAAERDPIACAYVLAQGLRRSRRGQALATVAVAYAKGGRFGRAAEVAGEIEDEWAAENASVGIAQQHARAGNWAEAEEWARRVERVGRRVQVWTTIGAERAKRGQKAQAMRALARAAGLTRIAGIGTEQATCKWAVGEGYLQVGEVEKGKRWLSEAVAATREIEDGSTKVMALVGIAGSYASSGERARAVALLEEARKGAQSATWVSDEVKRNMLVIIAMMFAEVGYLKEAVETARTIEGEVGRNLERQVVVEHCALRWKEEKDPTLMARGLDAARAIKDVKERALAMETMAVIAVDAGCNQEAVKRLDEAAEAGMAIRGIAERREKASLLCDIASMYGRIGEGEKAAELRSEALAVAAAIKDRYSMVSTLAQVGTEYAKTGRELSEMDFERLRGVVHAAYPMEEFWRKGGY